MYKSFTYSVALLFYFIALTAKADTEYYEYDFIDETHMSKTTLRFKKSLINKYPGWKHSRDKTVNISLWFPSLIETNNPNVWISNKAQREKSNTKPTSSDRKINIVLGNIGLNIITKPNHTSKAETFSKCKTKQSFEKFQKEGSIGIYDHFINIKRRPNTQDKSLYIPTKPINGVNCIMCNGATCQLFGISDIGIKYIATDKYKDSKMLQDSQSIHKAINDLINRKRVD